MIITHGNLVSNLAGAYMQLVRKREGERERRERERERGGGWYELELSYYLGLFFFQESNYTVSNDDIHISYLPLAHMMERIVQAMFLQGGGRIGFYRGDVKLLIEDIQALRPTAFVSVPRLLNRVYDKVGRGVMS